MTRVPYPIDYKECNHLSTSLANSEEEVAEEIIFHSGKVIDLTHIVIIRLTSLQVHELQFKIVCNKRDVECVNNYPNVPKGFVLFYDNFTNMYLVRKSYYDILAR